MKEKNEHLTIIIKILKLNGDCTKDSSFFCSDCPIYPIRNCDCDTAINIKKEVRRWLKKNNISSSIDIIEALI